MSSGFAPQGFQDFDLGTAEFAFQFATDLCGGLRIVQVERSVRRQDQPLPITEQVAAFDRQFAFAQFLVAGQGQPAGNDIIAWTRIGVPPINHFHVPVGVLHAADHGGTEVPYPRGIMRGSTNDYVVK